MSTCPHCFKPMTNNICPDCSRHIEFFEPDTSYIITNKSSPDSTPTYTSNHNSNYYVPKGHNKISTAGLNFNIIAAIVIGGICLFVAYQVMISK